MATDLIMRRGLSGLMPATAQAEEAIRELPIGADFKVTVKRGRNIQHHKLYWALVSLIHQNQSRYMTVENVSDALKIMVGHCEMMQLRNGQEIRVPKSISFAKMDQTEFNKFFERIKTLVITQILPGVTKAQLEHEIADMIGLERRAA